jgi:ribosomal protein L40E
MSRLGDRLSSSRFGLAATVVIVLAVCVGVWAMLRPSPNTPDAPSGLFFICKKCDNRFNKTMKQVSDHQKEHFAEQIPCPKCDSKDVIRANRCPKCGDYYPFAPRGAQPPCPKCGTAQPPPA